MKILMLVAELDCGGVETHIVSLAKALTDRGHKVTVASSGGRMTSELEPSGITHIKLPLSSHDPIRLAITVKKLLRYVKEEGINVIHAHSRIAAFVGSAVSRMSGVSMVTTVHARFRVGFLSRRMSRWGTLSVAVSEDLKQYLCDEYGVYADNITVIPNGIDRETFHKKQEEDKEKQGFNVVFVSRMDRDCSVGAMLLCDIATTLSQKEEGINIYLCGGGNALKKIEKEAARANKLVGKQVVHVLGYCSDVSAVLRKADVFVGVSRAALEAMAMGIPTVLCGNEGFFGTVDKENFNRAMYSNFCCRDMEKPKGEMLLRELEKLYGMALTERMRLGRNVSELVWNVCDNRLSAELVENIYQRAEKRVPCERGDIVLCGFYGFGNLGDDSLLLAAVERCEREYGNMCVSALTRGGKKDIEKFGVRCVCRSSPIKTALEIKRAKMLVFGGGTIFQEYTSRRSMLYYIGILLYARRNGVRCELWGNGIGEPQSAWSSKLLAKALGGCAYVGLRDSASIGLAGKICREFSVKCPPLLYEKDLAIITVGTSSRRIDFLLEKYGERLKKENGFAVISVSGRAGRGFVEILSRKIEMLCREGKGLLFVPMFPKEDMRLTKRLAGKFDGIVATSLSGRDIAGIMSESREVLGMRLHALVFAFSAGTPFFGIGADEKIESFCRENGGMYWTDDF